MFCSHLQTLQGAVAAGRPVEMENFFSRLTLDIIGKAVFDYDFDSLTTDDPVIKVHFARKSPRNGVIASNHPSCAGFGYIAIEDRDKNIPGKYRFADVVCLMLVRLGFSFSFRCTLCTA